MLALMDHPHIAKVFDGGVAANGRPFLVMEYVEGETLIRHCDQARMPIRDRLRLFIDVCRAVHHAHQKGVIHRDLKPSNLLVTRHDGTASPRVIDFGVGKMLANHGGSDVTFAGGIVGTLDYMSPEQANGGNVDTRADLYSLGVVLYELLTGTKPFAKQKSSSGAIEEQIRRIRSEEPILPSRRVAKEASSAQASERATSSSALVRTLRADLDWIVMKCLEKDPSRRYESAADLARDLERYLADLPVEATKPSLAYSVGKFVKRHRGVTLGSSVIAATLLIATGVSLWQAFRAAKAEATAQEQRDQANASARRADAQHQQTVEALTHFSDSLSELNPWQQPNPTLKLADMGMHLTKRVEGPSKPRPLVEATARQIAGRLFEQASDFKRAQKEFRTAKDLFAKELGERSPETLTCQLELANTLVQDVLGSSRVPTEGLEILRDLVPSLEEVLGPDHRITLEAKGKLGWAMWNLRPSALTDEKIAEARTLLEDTVAAYARLDPPRSRGRVMASLNLAQSLQDARFPEQNDRAEKLLRETRTRAREEFGVGSFPDLVAGAHLGHVHWYQARPADAVKVVEPIVAHLVASLGEKHRITLECREFLVGNLVELGRIAEAKKQLDAWTKAQLGDKTLNNVIVARLRHYYPAIFDYHEGQFEMAEQKLRDGIRLFKRDTINQLLYQFGIAACLIRQKRTTEAEHFLDAAWTTWNTFEGHTLGYHRRNFAFDVTRLVSAFRVEGHNDQAALWRDRFQVILAKAAK